MSGTARTNRVRVLQVVLDLEAGGLEQMVANLVRGLSRERFDVHLLALDFLGRNANGLDTVATMHVARSTPALSLLWPRALTQAIRRIAPDVVHTHSGVWYKASLAARRASVPRIIHTDHGRLSPDPWSDRVMDRVAARRTDLVVAVSDALQEQLRTTVLPHGVTTAVVPNGVDTRHFAPRPNGGNWGREHGIPLGSPVVATVGRFDPIKRHDLMLRAFAMVLANWGESTKPILAIAGEGPEEGALRRLSHDLAIDPSVRWLGWSDDVRDLLAQTTVFTLSSRSEGTSLSLLEAMSCGVCPVVTDVGGNAAVLGPALMGRLVPPGDAPALAAAYQVALRDENARKRDAAAARRQVEAHFSLEVMIRAYEDLYRVTTGMRP